MSGGALAGLGGGSGRRPRVGRRWLSATGNAVEEAATTLAAAADVDTAALSASRDAAGDPRRPPDEAVPAKADLLAIGGAATDNALTRTEDLSDEDPRTIARALLAEFGFAESQFGCLDSLWERESHWNVLADNPLLGLRHPAGPARLQDGLRRRRLGDQPGHPDPLGSRLHRGPLRLARAAPGATARATAGTGPRAGQGWVIDSTSRASSSCSSVSSPRSTKPSSSTVSRIVAPSARACLATLAAAS